MFDAQLLTWTEVYDSFTDVEPRQKLLEEVDEFMNAKSDREQLKEGADVMIAVMTQLFKQGYTFSDMLSAIETKLDTNIHRQWERMPDGTIHHI